MSKIPSTSSPAFLWKPDVNISLFFILPFLLIRDLTFTFTVTNNPYLLILAQSSILAISVGFTRPQSIVRYGLFPASVLLCAKALSSLRSGWTGNFAISTCLGYITSWEVLQYLVVALIEPWDFRRQGQVSNALKNTKFPTPPKDTIVNRLLFGYDAAYSQRHCGTPFEVSNVPAFSKRNPTQKPSRIAWLASTAMYVAISYLLLDIVAVANDPEMAAVMAAAEKVPFFSRLSEVTLEEVFQRLAATISVWILAVPVIYLSKRIAPILFVALDLQRVEQYKPLFNFAEGMPWSVRRFWSHFWHQMFKDKVYLPCKYLCDNILHLPDGSILRRYSLIVLTFALSGVAHVAGEYASGMDMWEDSGAMQFFVGQAGGIIIEDFVVYLWQMQFGKGNQTAWQIWLGRVWVVLFMFWSVPIWGYPQARLGDGRVVPWSVIEAFGYGK